MKKRLLVTATAGVAILAVMGGVFGVRNGRVAPPVDNAAGLSARAGGGFNGTGRGSIDQTITQLQDHLTRVPRDYPSWASLGLAYVQQAKVTVNSDYYPKAQGALDTSLAMNDDDNFLAYAGLSALASARHDFSAAESFARKGLARNASSPVLYGALGDALVQLGRYSEADEAIAKMASLRPDTSSFTRQSYLRELRGDVEGARKFMQQALNVSPTAADRAFTLFYLGELDFNSGDVNAALDRYREALAASPTDIQALAGKAKAEAALGQHLTAIDDYTAVVARAPEPGLVLEFGEFLQSTGRVADAKAQYDVVATTQRLFEANGVEPDATPTLFEADHGLPAVALANAEKGINSRPFAVMQDAYAWALHVNGRHAEALVALQPALQLGTRSALLHYHAGMIHLSLGHRELAQAELGTALSINPYFHPLAAPLATQALNTLGPVT
jgi:tetratricopeptide (TPR) repeat protein